MKFDTKLEITSTEQVHYKGNLYLSKELLNENETANSEQFLIQALPDIEFESEAKEINIDGEIYHHVRFYGVLPAADYQIKKTGSQMQFHLFTNRFDEIRQHFDFDVTGEEENKLETLATFGIAASLSIIMPDEILTSTVGEIKGNMVHIDLLNNYDKEIIVRSSTLDTTQKTILTTIVFSAFAYFVYLYHKEKQLQKKG